MDQEQYKRIHRASDVTRARSVSGRPGRHLESMTLSKIRLAPSSCSRASNW